MKRILLAILPGARIIGNKLEFHALFEKFGIQSLLKEKGFSTSTVNSFELANECLDHADFTILIGHTCWQSDIENTNSMNAIAFMQNLTERGTPWGILTALTSQETISGFLKDQGLTPCFSQAIENGFLEALSQKMQSCLEGRYLGSQPQEV